jgi:cytochrome P450
MFGLVGAPLDTVAEIRDDLEAIGLAMSLQKERMPRINEGIVRLEAFVGRLIDGRRANPREAEDLLDLLIEVGNVDGVTRQELIDLIMFFFIAGYDTSKNVLTFTMYTLMSHPDIYRKCAEDHDYCQKVVEEALRYFNPGTAFRFVDQDMVYRDVLLPKDTMVFFPLSVSGRDPSAFPDGDVFNPDRPIDKRHIAFGLGKHMCLGQFIARAQLQEGLHQIAQRIREPELAGSFDWRPFYGTWGLKGLPIRFTPAEAAESA